MILVVNDANILIDLIKLDILPQFFNLKLKFHTTSFILHELHDSQQKQLEMYINTKILEVEEFNQVELETLFVLQEEKPQLSQQDCTALFCAQKLKGTLLTSDKTLRQFAFSKKVAVHGHLWLLDLMVEQQQLTGKQANAYLKRLKSDINPKLGLSDHLCQPFTARWLNEK
jgi:predicted nucleic acid-binding protein